MKKALLFIVLIIIVVVLALVLRKPQPAEAPEVPQDEPMPTLGVVDLEASLVTYTGKTIANLQQRGTFPLALESSVELGSEGEILGGTLIFDLENLTSEAPGLARHLKNEDFFEVETYPQGEYVISEIVAAPLDPEHDIIINGSLTLKGETHPHNIAAQYNAQTGLLSFSTVIDRTRWGIDYNSPSLGEDFGDRAIDDMVTIEATIDID